MCKLVVTSTDGYVKGEVIRDVDRLQQLALEGKIDLRLLYRLRSIDGEWDFPEAA